MSYDISLTIDTGGKYPAHLTEYRSPTYNLEPMFRKALEAGGIDGMRMNGEEGKRSLDGMLAQDAIPVLTKALQDMRDKKAEYVELNPPNGWGRYENAVETFELLLQDCENHPKATVMV